MAMKTRAYAIDANGITPEMEQAVCKWISDYLFKPSLRFAKNPDGLLVFEWEASIAAHRELAKILSAIHLGIALGQGRYGPVKI